MKRFVVHIAILQHLETTRASRIVVFLTEEVLTAIHFASIDLVEGEYVSKVTIDLYGYSHTVWDYLNG
ncbi:MAG: hypothetical protein Q7S19_03995 [bacterium]|nr:hypothetical protein [bacterium]